MGRHSAQIMRTLLLLVAYLEDPSPAYEMGVRKNRPVTHRVLARRQRFDAHGDMSPIGVASRLHRCTRLPLSPLFPAQRPHSPEKSARPSRARTVGWGSRASAE